MSSLFLATKPRAERRRTLDAITARDTTAAEILERLSDLKNYPDEALSPYEEFVAHGRTYYFTPGGFLYRKDAWAEEVGGFFCGYLTDKAWHYRTSHMLVKASPFKLHSPEHSLSRYKR